MNASTLTVADLDPSERQPVEVWSRVMGYHRPVSAWNPGKQAEYRDRRLFTEKLSGPLNPPPAP